MGEKYKKITEARKRIWNQRGFTLVELLATIVILGILIAIAVPAIGSILSDSETSADAASIELMERAGELAYVDDLPFDEHPAVVPEGESYAIPTLIDEGYLKLDEVSKFNQPQNYVKKINKGGMFLYMGSLPVDGDDGDDSGETDTPVVDAGSCTIDGAYVAATDFDSKTVTRNVKYLAMTQNNDGNYVAMGQYGFDNDFDKYPRRGYALDEYDSNLKLVDSTVMEIGVFPEDKLLDGETGEVSGLKQLDDGRYVLVKNGDVYLFNESLEFVERIANPELTDQMQMGEIRPHENGSYYVAGLWKDSPFAHHSVGDMAIVKLDASFDYVDRVVLPRTADSYALFKDLLVLGNGDLLMAGGEESSLSGKMYRVDEDLNVVKETTVAGRAISGAGELADGSIVAYTSDESRELQLSKFSPELASVADVSINGPVRDDYYEVKDVFVEGNEFTVRLWNDLVRYDANLNELSSTSVAGTPMEKPERRQGRILKSGDTYVSAVPERNERGIEMTRNVSGTNHVVEAAPRAIHTALPREDAIVIHAPSAGGAYKTNYRSVDGTEFVDPAYAGSMMFVSDGQQAGPPSEMYQVLPSGELSFWEPFFMGEPSQSVPWFELKDAKREAVWTEGGAPAPAGLTATGGAVEQADGSLQVDPCYAGTFMTYLGDMSMYIVKDDGMLEKLDADPRTANPSDFNFDIYSDVLFYLHPNGDIVDFPDVASGGNQS